eukprot:TRINITY_DN31699_c0_g1_i1.p1 TRINITY_DN31699_c0_g1~~TRINITY_DN31699_c0_g1_i1.p1  ORF type:complete len:324 (+),score=97.37 TRINITY_DN31699_c0_g1_i1:55-1026(+)
MKGWNKGGWGMAWGKGKGWGQGSKQKKALPEGTTVDKTVRYQGTVTQYDKFAGYGWVELAEKGVVPDDKVFVYWKSISSQDRFPQLKPEMEIELGLHPYKSKQTGKTYVRAKNVSLPGGARVWIQEKEDAEKKEFVGGQDNRYKGTLMFYSAKTGAGKVKIDEGQADLADVPAEIRVETAEVNCGGKQPFNIQNQELPVEFGVWKTKKGLYKVYNMTLQGGAPLTLEAVEHRKDVGATKYTGTVAVNMWKQGYGFILPDAVSSLPAEVAEKMQQPRVGKEDTAEKMLYFREADVEENKWLKKGQEVTFQVYVDDKGAGAMKIA